MFCGCRTTFGASPNHQTCPVCLGHPGTLPVMNKKAVEHVIMTGLSIGAEIAEHSIFHRKNYFYPDLPKGYQISQYDIPLCSGGSVEVEVSTGKRSIGVTRVHLEEDTGKLIHIGGKGRIAGADYSVVDYNRSGVPLMEIVSEPDMRTPEEARAYVENLKAILQYLGVSDCNMEQGSLRCDANISLRPKGQEEFGTKAEIKNMNSFRSLVRALEYEIIRQTEVLEDGGSIVQETRHFDESSGATNSLRTKEYAHDYRYFPEPDLVPLHTEKAVVEKIRSQIPELPKERKARYLGLGLDSAMAEYLVGDMKVATFFEDAIQNSKHVTDVANWIKGDLSGYLNESGKKIEVSPVSPASVAGLVELLKAGTISVRQAKEVFEEMFGTGRSAEDIVKEKGIQQISNEDELREMVRAIIADNPTVVEELKSGKDKALGFLVGQLMKVSKGKANPQLANQLFKDEIAASQG